MEEKKRNKGTNPRITDTIPTSDIALAVSGVKSMIFNKRVNPLDALEVKDRIDNYFERCITEQRLPTVEAMSLCLGIDRSTLWRWSQGNGCSEDTAEVIRQARLALSSIDAELVLKGKINPVSYIFRAKNFYGMKDTQSLDIETPHERITSEEELFQKYSKTYVDVSESESLENDGAE